MTSQKHRDFCRQGNWNVPITQVMGVGEVYGKVLNERGYKTAKDLIVVFLDMSKDERYFGNWLECDIGMNAKYRDDCIACVSEWCYTWIPVIESYRSSRCCTIM